MAALPALPMARWSAWPDSSERPIGQTGGGRIELFNIASVPVTRYRYRGSKIPNAWAMPNHA